MGQQKTPQPTRAMIRSNGNSGAEICSTKAHQDVHSCQLSTCVTQRDKFEPRPVLRSFWGRTQEHRVCAVQVHCPQTSPTACLSHGIYPYGPRKQDTSSPRSDRTVPTGDQTHHHWLNNPTPLQVYQRGRRQLTGSERDWLSNNFCSFRFLQREGGTEQIWRVKTFSDFLVVPSEMRNSNPGMLVNQPNYPAELAC